MTLFVIGNVTEDIVFGLPRLPEEGETLIADSRISDIGGKGLNQALIASRCGMPVHLIAPVGRDEAGERTRAIVEAEPFEATLIDKEGPTDQSIIAVANSGENHIISSAFAASALTDDDVVKTAKGAGTKDQILMQGNLSQKTTLALLGWARDRGIETTINPSPIQWAYGQMWPLIDRLILNSHELEALSGHVDLEEGIGKLTSKGVREIIVTRGADGAVFASGQVRHRVAAAPACVVDTAGAGDTFCGVFVAALYKGHDHAAAMKIAARAAAITIGRNGTWSAFPSVAELSGLFVATTSEASE